MGTTKTRITIQGKPYEVALESQETETPKGSQNKCKKE